MLRQGVAVGKYAPRFEATESKVLSSTFSSSIPYISNTEKLSLIKFAKIQSEVGSPDNADYLNN